MTNKATILVVDDSKAIMELITTLLKSVDQQPYQVETACDGDQAWAMLEENPEKFDTVLLDRTMPGLDGIEVLRRIRCHRDLSKIPVILQTGAASKKHILEGMQAGAYYYLTKPIQPQLLLSVVDAALQERFLYSSLRDELNNVLDAIHLIDRISSNFRTLKEAKATAIILANLCPDPHKVVDGLAELLLNAVEHGNLGISYDEKSKFKNENTWDAEIESRLKDDCYGDRIVNVNAIRTENSVEYLITDEGEGFDWEQYMDFSPERMLDNHGRGIAMANKISFSSLEYLGRGNRVCAKYQFNEFFTLPEI